MKHLLLIIILLAGSHAISVAELSATESKYLKLFANYRGGMGIGFDQDHTYDYALRQAILKGGDDVIQRAYILSELPNHMESILHDLKKNQRMIGKQVYRDLTPDERLAKIKSFNDALTLFMKLDDGKHKHFYKDYKDRLKAIQKN